MRKTFLFILALCATIMAWGEDKTITETYVNAGTGASTSRVSFKSSFDENFTVWQRGGRSKTTDVVSIGGKDVKGFWLSRGTSSSCYIEWGETNKQYLGGVKSVSFAYKQFGSEANHTMILDVEVNGEKMDQISFPAGTSPYPTYSYSKDLNAKKLTKLTIRNSSTATEGTTLSGRFVVGPVTITPYLYCPSSAQNVQYKVSESATYINPDFIDNTDGEATWSCAPEGIVTVADGVVTPIEGKSGMVVITATLNDIVVSYNLNVIAKGIPEVSFEEPTITVTNLYTTEPVENKLTVTEGAGEVIYTSSNPLVAKIVSNQVTVVGVGTATITATTAENEDYVSASASYALTVNEPEGETAVKENFKGNLAKQDTYAKTEVSFTDQLGLYSWKANGYRYNETWVRLATTDEPYLKFDGNQEGGIKRLIFTWFRAGGTPVPAINTKITVVDGETQLAERSIVFDANDAHGSLQPYNVKMGVKQNAQLIINNFGSPAVMHFQDIKIVPYLLFTTKSDEAFLSLVDEYDVKNVLIDNTDDGEVVYSILTEGAKSLISNDGVVTFTNVTKSETITIQAAWTPDGESSATVITTMTLYVDVESKTDKTVKEEFSNYGETGWTSSEGSEVTKNGDVYDWRTKSTRHKTTDKLTDDQQAIWFAQGGYVATADATDNNNVGPAEGGIKRIAFDWNQNTLDQTGDDLYISVSVDGTEMSAIRRDGGARPEQPWQYIHNINVKKNATLKIENKSTTSEKEGGRVKIGTIVITPYLLYTKKELSAKLSDETAINVGICNNTIGGDINYTSLNPEVASLANDDPSHPDKLTLNSVGDAVIVATWTPDGSEEVVTTSYTLHVTEKEGRNLSFQKSVKETTVGGSDVTNTLNGTFDGTTQTWSTASEGTITSVDNDGLVSPVAIGTDTVTVVVAESGDYQEGTASYKVIVRTGVADNNKLVESFSGIDKDASTSEKEWKGDLQNYFSWKVKSTRHKGTVGDTIGGAGVAGTVLFAQGQIATDDVIEGGIKYFTFNWKQPYVEQGATLRLTLEAGEESYKQDYVVATDNGSTTHEHLYFAGDMQVKKNVQFILKNESFTTESGDPLTSNGRIAIDKFEIVPYLFYKTKSHKIDVVKGDAPTWTNDDLINNTEDGNIEYTIVDVEGEDVAEIDANGQVTAKSNGKAKVTATWTPADPEDGEVVTTTYEVEVFYSKLDAELAFDLGEISVGVDAIAFSTPTLSNPHELTVKYSSSNETIATVDENSGVVTLIGVAGDVVISATSEETDTYQEGKASYKIHVLPLPTVTFPNLTSTDNIKTVDMDQVPFTETILIKVNEEVVTSSATITYESSNEEVAVIKDGEVNIIGVGTAYITAKIAQTETYAGKDVYYTLTVEDNTPAGKQWTETFSSIGNVTDYITKRNSDIVGDSSIYSWAMRNYRRRQTQADSLATEQAIRLSNANNNYIETLNNQEGGIKRISFKWRTPGTEAGQLPINLNVSVCYNNYQDTVKRPMTRAKSKDNMTDNSYCSNFFVKQNAKLKIDIADETYSVMLIGPITITPYLLYTKKVVEVTYDLGGENTVDATANLINNIDEGTVTYSLSEGANAQLEEDGKTITLANETEDITVTATWGEVSTTFTLKVTKAEDPEPEPDFVLENKTAGALATVCLPNKIDRIENGTLYSINYGDTKSIEFIEADLEKDNAGMPYLVQVAEAGDVNFYYGEGDAVTEPVSAEDAKGFVGSLQEDNITVPDDGTAILVSGGQLHIAGAWCVLTQNHAYITTTYLPETATLSSAPRRTIRLYNPDAAPTNLNGLNGTVKPMKVLRDGQFYIIRDTKTYNAQGILVE